MAEKTTWIKIDRNILNWRWFTDRNTLQVFLWLLLNANIKPNGFMGVTVKRGEVATSYKTIASQSKMTENQARTAIQHLKTTGEITVTKHSKFSVISIVNYDLYQGQNPVNGPDRTQSRPSHVPVTSQQSKNIRKKERKNNIARAREEEEDSDRTWEAELNVPENLRGAFENREAWLEFFESQV